MARMNYAKMSIAQLEAAQVAIAAAIEQKKKSERDALKAEIAALASKSGVSLDELFGGARRGRKPGAAGKVAPKYRNPANASETWAGRGRQPRWLVAALKKGAKLDKFLIR